MTTFLAPFRYYEGGVSSVYLWDLDHGFAGVVLMKKAGDSATVKGCWDSIHVIEVQVSNWVHLDENI
jgi:capping protein beta